MMKNRVVDVRRVEDVAIQVANLQVVEEVETNPSAAFLQAIREPAPGNLDAGFEAENLNCLTTKLRPQQCGVEI